MIDDLSENDFARMVFWAVVWSMIIAVAVVVIQVVMR